MAIEQIRPGSLPPPLSREIPFSPKKIELPIPAESLRFVGEGRGVDLRYDRVGDNPYRDYEVHCFVAKAQEAARNEDQCFIVGPLLTDIIFSGEDFNGVRRPDFFKMGEELEFVEVKTSTEFMNEVRAKTNEENGFPKLAEIIRWDLSKRIRKVIPSIFVPNFVADPSKARFRFISPTSQEGRTTFERWRTPHQVIPLPEVIASALPIYTAAHAA